MGSAPWSRRRVHTSTRALDAASWRGVNCHRSTTLTLAPYYGEREEEGERGGGGERIGGSREEGEREEEERGGEDYI